MFHVEHSLYSRSPRLRIRTLRTPALTHSRTPVHGTPIAPPRFSHTDGNPFERRRHSMQDSNFGAGGTGGGTGETGRSSGLGDGSPSLGQTGGSTGGLGSTSGSGLSGTSGSSGLGSTGGSGLGGTSGL